MAQTGSRRNPAALGLMALLLLTSCGGEGSIDVPTPTRSATATSLPSRTASGPTRSPGGEESETSTPSETAPPSPTESATDSPSEEPTEEPTESETPTKKPEKPSPKPTEAPPSSAQSSSDAPSESESADDATADEEAEDAEESGVPTWVWWLLAAAALAALLAAILIPRVRRRNAWRSELAEAEGDAAWLARELLPQLQQATSTDQVAGGWQVGAGRVTALEDRLTGLETTAPDEAGQSRARDLRDGVRGARHGVEGLLVSGDPASIARDLGAIAGQLSLVLDPTPPGGVGGAHR